MRRARSHSISFDSFVRSRLDVTNKQRKTKPMNKYFTYALTILFATAAISIAATPDKAAMEAKEKAAWQAFKDKYADDFKKVLDKDIRCVYADSISTLQGELDSMQKWDMKS